VEPRGRSPDIAIAWAGGKYGAPVEGGGKAHVYTVFFETTLGLGDARTATGIRGDFLDEVEEEEGVHVG
jgi:hypothetical protein